MLKIKLYCEIYFQIWYGDSFRFIHYSLDAHLCDRMHTFPFSFSPAPRSTASRTKPTTDRSNRLVLKQVEKASWKWSKGRKKCRHYPDLRKGLIKF